MSGAEWQERALLPASSRPGKGHKESPRLPAPEQAPSTNPSSPRTWRAQAHRHAGIDNAAHFEPAVGGALLAVAPSKFSKKRKKPVSGVSTNEVVRPFNASRYACIER